MLKRWHHTSNTNDANTSFLGPFMWFLYLIHNQWQTTTAHTTQTKLTMRHPPKAAASAGKAAGQYYCPSSTTLLAAAGSRTGCWITSTAAGVFVGQKFILSATGLPSKDLCIVPQSTLLVSSRFDIAGQQLIGLNVYNELRSQIKAETGRTVLPTMPAVRACSHISTRYYGTSSDRRKEKEHERFVLAVITSCDAVGDLIKQVIQEHAVAPTTNQFPCLENIIPGRMSFALIPIPPQDSMLSPACDQVKSLNRSIRDSHQPVVVKGLTSYLVNLDLDAQFDVYSRLSAAFLPSTLLAVAP